ncbi:tryptophan dimethylallyltransferase-domain-containing protein [Xylaria nigripes]|nr:tryptophan dimethylallyltransferase-domain-containing protein [Xylaria nigripes]
MTVQIQHKQPVELNEVNPKLSRDRNAHQRLWCNHVGGAIGFLLNNAGYSSDFQSQSLEFFSQAVAPYLGAFHDKTDSDDPSWHSFMTDDGSPVELSWDWGTTDSRPTIRYSIEPIGLHAGMPIDPSNAIAGPAMQRDLIRFLPQTNLEWFQYFKEFFDYRGEKKDLTIEDSKDHNSSVFYAFDLAEDATTAKVYFFPKYRAASLRLSRLEVLTQAINGAPYCTEENLQAYKLFSQFTADPATKDIEYEMLALDMIDPRKSRLKIYFRNRETSFDSVINVMTLGGRISTPELSQGLENLKHLRNGLFQLESNSLKNNNHRTAGILYNVEFRLGDKFPVAKVYLPVRHYSRNDNAVIGALGEYLWSQKRGKYMVPYCGVMTDLFGYKRLSTKAGVHTYIGCTIRPNGDLRIVSYFKTPF